MKGRINIYVSRKDEDRREGLISIYLGRRTIERKDYIYVSRKDED